MLFSTLLLTSPFVGAVEALNKDCAEEDFKEGGIMIEGQKQLCDKDTKTGKYCKEIIEEFPYIGNDVDKELPLKYLCEPCYIEDQRERIDKEYPKSVLAEKPATAAADKTLTTTATSSKFSKVPTTVQSGDETITTAETTPTSTTTSAEVTDSPKDSLGGKVESGKAGNYWGFVLVPGLNVFRL
ncbi:uncharacterized protein FIESC28_02494 [Fusarium coffeatum]|uniref:LysM domain-containing protein n=1 Tax=Fusarium coffeatum TaxID=231269 RepID=A0A366S5V9_9HYPO|nr:uncharacterized protein FIESC28_02494 [Fusarium coffeatum]RBR24721.1 hypothetical protein FIESC28_02494 [Fusarium coffeatum]